jgi:hypothetical protein
MENWKGKRDGKQVKGLIQVKDGGGVHRKGGKQPGKKGAVQVSMGA